VREGRAEAPVLLALLAALGCGPANRQEAPVPPRPRALVLVSIDGFRADYLDRPWAVRLRALATDGVRARWLRPVAPTLTFPNHYTIVTGLYPAHHGIVGNTIRDSAIGTFTIGDTVAVRDPRWWGGEPIWVTAEKQGRRAAAFFWPGTEAALQGIRPTWHRNYDPGVPASARVDQVLAWLRRPREEAPAFVTLYFGEVDEAGHRSGPESAAVDSAIARVDSMIGRLDDGLVAARLADSVDVIVLSDHGMAEVDTNRLIYLDDYVDTEWVRPEEWAPTMPLRPMDGRVDEAYRSLKGRNPHFAVYRLADLPPRYHYEAGPRMAPVVALAEDGWLPTTHARRRHGRLPKGMHGYDPEAPSMRALFLARGPSFRHGAVVPPFENVHLYALMTALLGLRPAPGDGTLDSIPPMLVEAR